MAPARFRSLLPCTSQKCCSAAFRELTRPSTSPGSREIFSATPFRFAGRRWREPLGVSPAAYRGEAPGLLLLHTMPKAKTPSLIVTLRLRESPQFCRRADASFQAATQLTNVMTQEARSPATILRADPDWPSPARCCARPLPRAQDRPVRPPHGHLCQEAAEPALAYVWGWRWHGADGSRRRRDRVAA